IVRGTASDRGCGVAGRGTVARVTISVSRKRGASCQYLSSKGRLGRAKSCASLTWLAARGTSQWAFRLPKHLGRGTFVVRAQAIDSAGNVSIQRYVRDRL